jgi:hypothetical protein
LNDCKKNRIAFLWYLEDNIIVWKLDSQVNCLLIYNFMSKVKNTLPDLAAQLVRLNNNIAAILEGQNRIITARDSSVSIEVSDANGNTSTSTLPSVSFIQSQVNELRRNLSALSSLSGTSSIISDGSGSFRKIIAVDVNQQPPNISSLNSISSFTSEPNWFFDSLMSHKMNITINLTDKIPPSVNQIDSYRYIVKFNSNADGVLTTIGDRARVDFETRFKNNIEIDYDEFIEWTNSTSGISEIIEDPQRFNLEPLFLRFSGIYGVLRTEEDPINNRIWYVLDTLNYTDVELNTIKELAVGDMLTLNTESPSSRFKIIEIDTTQAQPRIRVERQDGLDAIPVGLQVLRILSPLSSIREVKISVGFNEYQVIFIRPIRSDNNVRSEEWSLGAGFYTNDLTLSSTNKNLDGLTMSEYYVNYIQDYGAVLRDIVQKKIPEDFGETPDAPVLNASSFKVRLTNEHLINSPDSVRLRELNNTKTTVSSEIEQLNEAINQLNVQIQNAGTFPTRADQERAQQKLNNLIQQKAAKSTQLRSLVADILSTQTAVKNISPRYRLQGFWGFPAPKSNGNSKPQQIVQFKVRYKYSNLSGEETPIGTIPLEQGDGTIKNASVSQWTELLSKPRKQIWDESTQSYIWVDDNVSDTEEVNTNFIDLPIQAGEQITLQVKSISEVGYPDAPLESDWSNQLTIPFQADSGLSAATDTNILTTTLQEDQRLRFENELNARGLTDHVATQRVVDGKLIVHDANQILTTQLTSDGRTQKSVQTVIDELTNEIARLRLALARVRGSLEVYIKVKDKLQLVQNGQTYRYPIVLTQYAERVSNAPIPTWVNRDYTITDYKIVIKNASTSDPLGLFSRYTENQILNPFNKNTDIRALFTDESGVLRKQTDNQFVWLRNTRLSSGSTGTNATLVDWTIVDDSGYNTQQLRNLNLGWSQSTFIQDDPETDPETGVQVHRKLKEITTSGQFLSVVSAHAVRNASQNNLAYTADIAKTLSPSEEIEIPIHLYFLLDNRATNGVLINPNYAPTSTSNPISDDGLHIKVLTFEVQPENQDKPFRFEIEFNIRANAVEGSEFATFANSGKISADRIRNARTR